jgi:hypothetical protein
MYVEKVGLAKPLSAFGDELVKYMNDYEKIYDVPGVLDKLRLVYPFYDIFYRQIYNLRTRFLNYRFL